MKNVTISFDWCFKSCLNLNGTLDLHETGVCWINKEIIWGKNLSRTISKISAGVLSGFPNTRKLMKVRSCKPSAFIVFDCLETPMKPDVRVFEIASQSRLRNKIKWKYSRIFLMLSASLLLRKIVLWWWFVFSETVWEMLSHRCGWLKKTSLTVLFILFCNGFITFSTSKIWKEAKLLKSDVPKSTRYKRKWASGIFEQWQKEGLIRVINIQIKKGVH